MAYVGQIKEITIDQLMNIVPLIQEKWSFIGTRLKLSSDKLDDICQAASEQQIPAESKNTFCCVKMLTSWYVTVHAKTSLVRTKIESGFFSPAYSYIH